MTAACQCDLLDAGRPSSRVDQNRCVREMADIKGVLPVLRCSFVNSPQLPAWQVVTLLAMSPLSRLSSAVCGGWQGIH